MSTNTSAAAPIKTIIIDDEPLARSIVREYLQSYPQIDILQECNDGFEGIKAIQQHHPDLIFLDIQMPKINGFEMLELVDQPPAVIFTTAFDEYAIKAFETHAVDYLLKPFSKERFDKAMQKWLDQHALAASATSGNNATATSGNNATPKAGNSATASSVPGSPAAPGNPASGSPAAPGNPASGAPASPGNSTAASSAANASTNTEQLLETAAQSPSQQQRVVVKTGGKIKIIPLEDIHFLEAADDYVKIHTHNGAFLKNRTMSWFEKALDPSQFVRTHRSYILNVQQVTRIDPYEKDSHLCILQSGAQVPVSKAGYVKLKAVLGL
ncbi:MAG TPA: LytTR family transcriptional regulator DNA-binding domain-containing protein [Puia sp.]|nr:LytTR family transcriptional regulator DNA-binding domain-containing protein [Puia sp.]